MKKVKLIAISVLSVILFSSQVVAVTTSNSSETLVSPETSTSKAESSLIETTSEQSAEEASNSENSKPTESSSQPALAQDQPTNPSGTEASQSLTWVERTEYFTITDPSKLFTDQELTIQATEIKNGSTVKIIRSSQTENGELLLFQTADKRQFYGKTDAGTITNDPFGVPTVKEGYLVITNDQATIVQSSDGSETTPAKNYLKTTLTIKAVTQHFNGTGYYQVANTNGEILGWLPQNDGKVTPAQGDYHNHDRYLTLKGSQSTIWTNFTFTAEKDPNDFLNRTLLAKGIYYHADGKNYLSVYEMKNNKEIWVGYVEETQVSFLNNPQGNYQVYDRYVTITRNDYTIWSSFNWSPKRSSKSVLGNTYLAKGRYLHYNGSTYLSLYDSKNNWIGYINSTGTSVASGPQGIWQSCNKYVSISNKSYSLWSSFAWIRKQSSGNIFGKTYLAQGQYKHFNGSTYYSLYDSKNRWQGYINSTGVKLTSGPQGIWQSFNKYITVTNKSYTVWNSFSWNKKQSSANLAGKTYLAQGQYKHYNGETYYSLYDNKKNWQGYINATGVKVASGQQGIWQKGGPKVILTKQNWDLWSSFAWKSKGKSNNYRSKLFTAQGYYQHFNGSRYLSLYDNTGKWYGYINSNATRVESSTKNKIKRVQDLLNRKYRSANYGIYVTSLIDGETAQINGSQTFMGASTGKLPALYYTQKMINEKKLNPHKLYPYTDQINRMTYSYMRGGAGILQNKKFGTNYSLYTIMEWTCKYSDNQGANFLGYYGANKYDAKMRNEISRVIGRRWNGIRYVTARENSLLLKEMYHNGGNVLNYLSNTTYDGQRLPKYLPVRVAHKIGDLYGYAHDCGIVYTNKPYIISLMTNNSNYETISKLSKEVYDLMK